MKFDFNYYNPTKIYFGKNSLDYLEKELKNFGKNILLAYGRSSIKRIGLYDKVVEILKKSGKNITEFSGIMPNPTYSKLLEGAKLVRENNIDLILGVGGGSVIDCTKGVAASAYCEGDAFQKYWLNNESLSNKIIPVASIVTMSGTASEMNGGSVITHEDLKLKIGHSFEKANYPKFSILNPEFTYSVPKYQMVSGVFDIMSHIMEQYFSGTDDNVSDALLEALMKTVVRAAKIALKDPKDYEARSNIMWGATMALNGILKSGKEQDWEVHMIEHQLGVYTDCAHGMGLATISIPYYKMIYKHGLPKFVQFAKNVWDINPTGKTDNEIALLGLDSLTKFIKDSGIVTSIKELGATREMLPKIVDSTYLGGYYKKLTREDVLKILEACF